MPNLTINEVDDLRYRAVRNWRDFTPGIYKFVYPHLNSFEWIVVTGIRPDGYYTYVSLRTPGTGYGLAEPYGEVGSLADAGVLRTKNGYLGKNFVVKWTKAFDPTGSPALID